MHSSLIDVFAYLIGIYAMGFLLCLTRIILFRWHVVEEEVARLNSTDGLRYRVTADGVALILCSLWPLFCWLWFKESRAKNKILP